MAMPTSPHNERQRKAGRAHIQATYRLGAELRDANRERFETLYTEECAKRGVERKPTT